MGTRLVVCRREELERMVVEWTGVKSSTSFSTTDVEKLLAVGYREERRAEREEERVRGLLRRMDEMAGGEVRRRGSNCSSRTGCSERRWRRSTGEVILLS